MSPPALTRPAVFLFHHPGAPPGLVEAFTFGWEEEGVPVVVVCAEGPAGELSRKAAEASTLFAGAGIDGERSIAIHEQRLGSRSPLMLTCDATAEQAKVFGLIAGRLVRGRPIPPIVADNN